jgi:hypothetical protein
VYSLLLDTSPQQEHAPGSFAWVGTVARQKRFEKARHAGENNVPSRIKRQANPYVKIKS